MIDAAYYVKKATAIVWCAVIAPTGKTACGLSHAGWSREAGALGCADDVCPNCESVLATTVSATRPRASVTLIGKVSP